MKLLYLICALTVVMSAVGCADSTVALRTSRFLVLPDQDRDALPDGLEIDLGTDPRLVDTDGDSLSDYWEVRKYGTDPLSPDSDGDGVADGEWEERSEFTRTIQAIVELRPPFDVRHMNDLFQDARRIDERGDVTRVEVVLYPDARPLFNAGAYQPTRDEHTQPTYAKNYSSEMKSRIRRRLASCVTDVQIVSRILQMMREIRHVDLERDLACESDLPVHFYVHRDALGAVHESGMLARYDAARREMVERNVLFADSMWRLGACGACGSTSILRGAMLRAAGIPEKTIMTIPLLYSYETDGTKIEVESDYSRQYLDIPSNSTRICDHFFNEAWIGNQWIRVDNKIGADGIIIWGKVPAVKILECDDPTDYNIWQYWNYETYRTERPYKYQSVIERPARHSLQDRQAAEG